VVGLDLLGDARNLLLEHGTDVLILRRRVMLQEVGDRAQLLAQRGEAAVVRGVHATCFADDGEQLGADALVDPAVQVEHDGAEADWRDGGGVENGHGWGLLRSCAALIGVT
jgi:hypothetical protein